MESRAIPGALTKSSENSGSLHENCISAKQTRHENLFGTHTELREASEASQFDVQMRLNFPSHNPVTWIAETMNKATKMCICLLSYVRQSAALNQGT